MAYTHLLTQEEREKRNEEITIKFNIQYHPGVKKYYLYGLLAKEYNLKIETICRFSQIIRLYRSKIDLYQSKLDHDPKYGLDT
jgi:hypothetical protein